MGNKNSGSTRTAEEMAQMSIDAGGSVEGKVAIVTGANSGIGAEATRVLVKHGAKVIMGCRNVDKAQGVLERIQSEDVGEDDAAVVIELDLADFDSIRRFVDDFHALGLPLDILINNAGVMMTPEWKTKQGLEYQIGINHFGHFLLTHLLLDDLKAAAPSRVVNLASGAHLTGKMDFDDLFFENRSYGGSAAYAQSKLANILFTKQLAKELQDTGVTANCLHPGVIQTDLTRDSAGARTFFTVANFFGFTKSIEQGAATTIYAAMHPDGANLSGEYFDNCAVSDPSSAAKDMEAAQRLWDISLDICNKDETK